MSHYMVVGLLLWLNLLTPAIHAQTPTPIHPPLEPYTIAGLQARDYPGGTIQIRAIREQHSAFTRAYIDYPSDELTITGDMYIPAGTGPFPVVILLHGYYDRAGYWTGLGTWQNAEYLARNGYLTIAPDFRSWGESDTGINLFATGLVIDTLNLISSLASLPQADVARVGVWGHSMGGGVATKVLTIDDRIKAGVLYAPNSANDADLMSRWGAGCLPGESQQAGDQCNPAEIIPPDASDPLTQAYFAAATDPVQMQHLASIYHLENISAPIQIHIGTADGQTLVQTPPEWSFDLYTALQTAEKEVTYWEYADQGHFFTGASWSLFMERTVGFFDEHLK